MNNRVKVGIAAVIVVSLVALIALDVMTNGPAPAAPGSSPLLAGRTDPAADDDILFRPLQEAVEAARTEIPQRVEEQVLDVARNAAQQIEQAAQIAPRGLKGATESLPGIDSLTPSPALKGAQETLPLTPPPSFDSYIIQPGDSLYTIAEKVYGNPSKWQWIAEANPDVKPQALKVGRKIVIPARPSPSEPADVVAMGPTPIDTKIYTVRSGDTLSGISKKVFNTTRYSQEIYDLNRERLSSPDALEVGMKLTLPDVSAQVSTPVSLAAPSTVPVGGTVHTVAAGDSLWKIAERYANGVGILEKMDEIVRANADKLPSQDTSLRVGWKLVIPE